MRISDWSSDVCSSDLLAACGAAGMVEAFSDPAEAALAAALRRLELLPPAATARFTPLAGGVSSDIWRVDLPAGPVCVKRALPRLKVAADWHAPIERNAYEVAWFETVGAILPEAAPRQIGRASCRERVGQRVDLGGRRTLQKKKK